MKAHAFSMFASTSPLLSSCELPVPIVDSTTLRLEFEAADRIDRDIMYESYHANYKQRVQRISLLILHKEKLDRLAEMEANIEETQRRVNATLDEFLKLTPEVMGSSIELAACLCRYREALHDCRQITTTTSMTASAARARVHLREQRNSLIVLRRRYDALCAAQETHSRDCQTLQAQVYKQKYARDNLLRELIEILEAERHNVLFSVTRRINFALYSTRLQQPHRAMLPSTPEAFDQLLAASNGCLGDDDDDMEKTDQYVC